MSIRLDEREVAEFLAATRTGVLITLRRDGMPVPVPLWFVSEGSTIRSTTPATSKKVARIRHDPRASFIVEAGTEWKELKAVILVGRAVVVDNPQAVVDADAALATKYSRSLGTSSSTLPDATRTHYSTPFVVVQFEPSEPPLSWDNAKIRFNRI